MSSIFAPISAAYASGFDASRGVLIGKDAKLVFLRETGTTVPFSVELTLPNKWDVEFSEKQGDATFKIADITSEFAMIVRKSTHFMVIDSDNPGLNNVLHEKLGDEVKPPLGDEPFWKVGAHSLNRVYVAPEEH
jgi:hypothetical protein